MNLKEKLAAIREQQKAAPAPAPVEAPPLPAPAPVEAPAPAPVPGDLVRQKLLELGAKKQINPPPVVPVIDVGTKTEEGEIKEVELSVNVEAPKKPEKTLEPCPVCGESFKVLAKHRCKGKEEKTEPPPPKVQETQYHDYILLIDCLPIGGQEDIVRAEKLTDEIKAKICEAKKVEHWKLVEYGGGSAFLQTAFEKYWYGAAFTGIVLLSTSSLEYPSVVETLITHARAVYRGIK